MIPVKDLKETSHAPHVFVNMFFQILISDHLYTCRLGHFLFCFSLTLLLWLVLLCHSLFMCFFVMLMVKAP